MTSLYGIIGYPVKHSLSPAMHNAAFKELGIDAEYKVFEVPPDSLDRFLTLEVDAKRIKGLSVTIPHKIACMRYLNEISEEAKEMGAVNTIRNDGNWLVGENFDWYGVHRALTELCEPKGKKVVMVGAGGSGRACAYAVLKEKVESLTVLVRDLAKYKYFTDDFNCKLDLLENIYNYKADIIINATSIGMSPYEEKNVFPEDYINEDMVVFDVVYTPLETELVKIARRKGCKVITGDKMLLYQALKQFEFWTEKEAPKEVMEKALMEKLE